MSNLVAMRPEDTTTWREVFETDVYRLGRRDLEGKGVLDVGANVGFFAYACASRGARIVVAVEPEPENFALLEHNVAPWGQVVTLQAAVGPRDGMTRISGTGPTAHTGDEGKWVRMFQLDHLLNLAVPVELVKIDVEGAEDCLLHTSTDVLATIPSIVVEVHGPPEFPWVTTHSRWDIEEHLSKTHHVETLPLLRGLALLYAERTP